MAEWDKRSAKQIRSLQDELVRTQVRAVGSSAAYWKQRFAVLGRTPGTIDGVERLATLPAAGERDVSPQGDPAAMAGLVVHGGERQFALHTSGPQLRRAVKLRLIDRDAYRRVVESETTATSFVWSGLGFRYPLASTRGDLDVVARAGARLWQVLGLTRDDALLSAVPVGATVEHTALHYAALAAGAPAMFPGATADALAAAARLAPPTVLAVPAAAAPDAMAGLAGADALQRLTTLLLVGAPSDAERSAATQALLDAGRRDAVVLAVHAPSGARVLWGECRQSGGATGLHTYPDLDLVQVVDPETGENHDGHGELVLTQLGLRGSALVRWRTGDLVTGVESESCRGCGRTVPRVTGTTRHALVVSTERGRALDLRAVAGALAGRADIGDWRVVVGARTRDERGQVVVHVTPGPDTDPAEVAVAAASDIKSVAGMLPSQLVVTDADQLAAVPGRAVTNRLLRR